jgi:hypothetical protein
MAANKASNKAATMLDKPAPAVEETNRDIAERWVLAFDAALRARSKKALADCFVDDSHWRNLFGISWYFATFSGRDVLVRELLARSRDAAAVGFRIDAALLAPRGAVVAGRDVIEAVIRFDTVNGPGFGAIRLLPSPDGEAKAWTISTTLDHDRICAARDGERSTSHVRDFAEADWLERRRERAAYAGRDPDVLVVGGGHTGISAAVEVQRMGLSTLIVDREERIGDNWRLRYAPLHARLEQAGFRLEFGEDGTGWPLKFRTRGGGYYFNVGCSELIADGKIRLVQFADIERFTADGFRLKDGSALDAELFVLATGYKGLDHLLEKLFGREVAARVGRVWGFDDPTQELRNMWGRTGQPGLWFTAGAFSQARIYSRYIALQIDAIERGVLAKQLG